MFDYHAPHTLQEACELLAGHPQARPLLGGTDLLVRLRSRHINPTALVDLKGLDELQGIEGTPDGGLSIGAAVTFNQLLEDSRIHERYQVLHQAAARVAAYPVRNRATLVGNLGNASPAADSAPPLLVLGATVQVASTEGRRELAVDDLLRGPGKTSLQPGELITRVLLPPDWAGLPGHYGRQARRRALDLATVGVAVLGKREGNGGTPSSSWTWRLAACAVAPVPLRLFAAERVLADGPPDDERVVRAARAAADEVSPITDVRSGESYRREMVEVHTRRGLQAVRQAWGG